MDFKIRQRHCNRIWYRYVWRNEWKRIGCQSVIFARIRLWPSGRYTSCHGNQHMDTICTGQFCHRTWSCWGAEKRIIPHWCSPHAQRFSFHSSPGYYRWNRKYSGFGISGREFKHTRRKRIPSDDQFSTIWLSVGYQWLLERSRRIANAAGHEPFQRPLCACLFLYTCNPSDSGR